MGVQLGVVIWVLSTPKVKISTSPPQKKKKKVKNIMLFELQKLRSKKKPVAQAPHFLNA